MTSTSFNMSRLREIFKNLKSDALPRAPRPSSDMNNEPVDEPNVHIEVEDDEEEEIIITPEENYKKKPNKVFKSREKKKTVDHEEVEEEIKPSKEKRDSSSSVNVQATGNVYNIVNSSHLRFGHEYYFGPVSAATLGKNGKDKNYENDVIKKDNFITLLSEAKMKPDHSYLDYISKNLGKNWHTFFRSLGFTQGRIETFEINAAGYDISEARYKLLLDWVNNDDDGTLGRLTTLLWEEGERSIVKELSLMYMKSKKQ